MSVEEVKDRIAELKAILIGCGITDRRAYHIRHLIKVNQLLLKVLSR